MKLISNAKYTEPVESGTIFTIKDYGFDICIHKIRGCGSTWYLNCSELCINNLPLKNKNLFGCVADAKEIIKYKLDALNARFNSFYEDKKIEISRY